MPAKGTGSKVPGLPRKAPVAKAMRDFRNIADSALGKRGVRKAKRGRKR